MRNATLPRHEVVLLGIGHTNAHVLRMWRMYPPRDARLTCISNFPIVTYSGMLPGVLSGQYSHEQMQIDLVRLCAASGARLIVGNVTGIDPAQKRILFDGRSSIPFDLLSIGIGSVPSTENVTIDSDRIVPIKPMQTFLRRLDEWVDRVRQSGASELRACVVGAGAGGFEISLCLDRHLRKRLGDFPITITVVHGLNELIGGVRPQTSERARRELESRGIKLVLGRRVTAVNDRTLRLDDGQQLDADVILWSTGAVATPLLKTLGLKNDDRGFLLTKPTLQSVDDPTIFAVGDSGTIAGASIPKAGVYAVRQGPVLWDNICRTLRNETLTAYEPQTGFLKLFNLGDGRAMGEYKGYTFTSRWAWRLKDRIDRKFMAMYQDYDLMEMESDEDETSAPVMRCAGCGGKVGGSILSHVLERLDVPPHEQVLLGLDAPDDAAILRFSPGKAVNATVDFFAAPLDDPYTVGRLAALNSASDCFATNARPIAALAAISLPHGRQPQQEQLLYELLDGALREFRAMGATLVGGHTIEGPQLTVGFTVLAEQQDPPRTKRNLRRGDQLILTKPLGTGALLAAWMRAACKAEWFESLLESMLLSNQLAAELCDEFGVEALTDVTGFGLAGHLLEMLRSSDVAAEVQLSKIPLLPGASEILESGLESTLAPANRHVESEIAVDEPARRASTYKSLFDPQTCGGLLMGVPEHQVDRLLERLQTQSGVPAARIGCVTTLDKSARLKILQ